MAADRKSLGKPPAFDQADAALSGPTGRARVAGVIGWPVSHSLSPRLHGFWLRRYHIDGAYVPLPVDPERLEEAFAGLAALGLVGANITIPYKERASALVDGRSEVAARIGAVNTVIVTQSGGLYGTNTDAFGFIENLRTGAPTWRGECGPAVILGAGGAARAVAVALLDAGVPVIRLMNRNPRRAEALAMALASDKIQVRPWAERDAALAGAALVVNATSLGMNGHPELALDLGLLPGDAVVNDIVYVPAVTALLAQAKARGLVTVSGLGMLLHQARPAFRAWFDIDPEVDEDLRRHVARALAES